MKQRALAVACTILLGFPAHAQITNYTRAHDGVVFETPEGKLKLKVISNAIVQVIALPTKELPQRKSLAEVDNLTPTGMYSIKESANEYMMKTSELVIKIDKGYNSSM